VPILSAPEKQTLAAFCDTLVPHLDAGAGDDARLMALSAADTGLPRLVEEALALAIDAGQLSQLRQFLGLLEARVFNGAIAGHWQPFSRLPLASRTDVLYGLATHRLPQLRKAFSGIGRLSLSTFYSAQPGEAPNPAHAALKYGIPPRRPVAARPITLLDTRATQALSCDVLVVGSGAGGGVTAAELAAAGHDVIVFEKGEYIGDEHYDGRELAGRTRLYERRGTLTTADGTVLILAGSTLGGGTTINWSGAVRPPAQVLQDWEREFGFEGVAGPGFQRSLDAVSERIGVDVNRADQPSANTRVFEDGLRALGYDVTRVPRNVSGCADDCGFCMFGCGAGTRQGTVKTYLQDACARGARIVAGAEVERLLQERGAISGATVRVKDAKGGTRQLRVTCKAVVLAAGAIHTPAVLLRSGLRNRNIGRHLRLHPTTGTSGLFAEPIRAWRGAPMTRLSAQFANLDAKGYGVRLMNAPAHPGTLAFATPWLSGRHHKQVMQESEHTANITVVTRDRKGGRVRLDAAGTPVVDYSLSRYDAGHLLTGIKEALRVHVAAGAVSVHSPQSTRPAYRPAVDGSLERFLKGVEDRGIRPHDVALFSAHQMSSARIAASPRLGVANPAGEAFEVKRLFIADGSVLPTCSGVNPMLTILGTAHFLSQQIKARL
jgi:choline dehydrogenase-like flavoprotein